MTELEGLMMDDYPLSLTHVVERAERLSPRREVVARRPDGEVIRTTYGDCACRARKLAGALKELGVGAGDRVATMMWNQPEHLDCYFAAPAMGAVVHTLNPRLHRDELAFIAADAEDRVIVVDETVWEMFESFASEYEFEHVIVVSRSDVAPRRDARLRVARERRRAAGVAEAGRAARGGHVLHVGHHRPAQGRPLLASRARAAFDGRGAAGRDEHLRARRRAAGRAHVPRQRLGHRVHRPDGRGRARAPRAAPRRRERPRPAGRRAGDAHRRACPPCGWPCSRRSTTIPSAGT